MDSAAAAGPLPSPLLVASLVFAGVVSVLFASRKAREAAFRLGVYVYAVSPVGLLLHRLLFMSSGPVDGPLEGHSSVLWTPFRGFSVLPIAVSGDNYAYLLVDEATRDAALVDPADPAVCLRAVELAGVRLTHVLTTHKHHDHAGGNADVLAAVPGVEVVGGRRDGVLAATREVGDGDTVKVGSTVVKVIDTPGHTRGHVVYAVHPPAEGAGAQAGTVSDPVLAAANARRWPDEGIHSAAAAVDPVAAGSVAAFTGDLLFSAGCGRFFEGNAADFYEALVRRLGAFADSTLFFCGHEYTAANLAFAQWAEPGSQAIAKKVAWVRRRREAGACTVPFSLAEERLVNPFMRVHELSRTLEGGALAGLADAPVATMARLRELKNAGAHKMKK